MAGWQLGLGLSYAAALPPGWARRLPRCLGATASPPSPAALWRTAAHQRAAL